METTLRETEQQAVVIGFDTDDTTYLCPVCGPQERKVGKNFFLYCPHIYATLTVTPLCSLCQQFKPKDTFVKNTSGYCKDCYNSKQRAKRAIAAQQRTQHAQQREITYNAVVNAFLCPVCGKQEFKACKNVRFYCSHIQAYRALTPFCTRCKQFKPRTEFRTHHISYCVSCQNDIFRGKYWRSKAQSLSGDDPPSFPRTPTGILTPTGLSPHASLLAYAITEWREQIRVGNQEACKAIKNAQHMAETDPTLLKEIPLLDLASRATGLEPRVVLAGLAKSAYKPKETFATSA